MEDAEPDSQHFQEVSLSESSGLDVAEGTAETVAVVEGIVVEIVGGSVVEDEFVGSDVGETLECIAVEKVVTEKTSVACVAVAFVAVVVVAVAFVVTIVLAGAAREAAVRRAAAHRAAVHKAAALEPMHA